MEAAYEVSKRFYSFSVCLGANYRSL